MTQINATLAALLLCLLSGQALAQTEADSEIGREKFEKHCLSCHPGVLPEAPLIEALKLYPPERIIESMIGNFTLTGDVSEMDRVIAELQRFKAAGLNEIALGLHDEPADAIKMIGEYVVPALNG